MTQLVGITGYAGAGKDEFAKSLALRGNFHVMGMSDALLEMALILNPILVHEDGQLFELERAIQMHGYTEAKRLFPAVREFLQILGTEAVRDIIGEDSWTRAAERVFVPLLGEGRNVAITGIRFENEYHMIKRYGGKVVKVVRPGVEASNGHTSDTSVDQLMCDKVIFNNGTLDDLAQQAQRFLNGE